MLSAFHELLVDDLARIVLARLDVDSLLDDRIGPAAQSLACPILQSSHEHAQASDSFSISIHARVRALKHQLDTYLTWNRLGRHYKRRRSGGVVA